MLLASECTLPQNLRNQETKHKYAYEIGNCIQIVIWDKKNKEAKVNEVSVPNDSWTELQKVNKYQDKPGN